MFGSIFTNPILVGLIIVEAILLPLISFLKHKYSEYTDLLAFLPLPIFMVLCFVYNVPFEETVTASIVFVLAIFVMLFIRLGRRAK